MTRLSATVLLCLLSGVTAAQAVRSNRSLASDPRPSAGAPHVLPLSAIDRTIVPPINLDEVRKEDEDRERSGEPPRFAISTPAETTPWNAGTWEDLDDDTLLWRLRIQGQGAKSLNLGFARYHMPAGGTLVLYSADSVHLVRPFTAEDNEEHGQLWTPVVSSDDVVLEVAVPKERVHELGLKLTHIGYGYRGFGVQQGGIQALSGACNVDVICPEGDDWRLEIPAIGVISTGGSTFCTGFMVNNTSNDLTPYFMTAFHCGIGAGNAPSLVVYWNYENSFCRPPGSGASGSAGDGTLTQFNTGSIHRASYSPSDVTLVELDDDPDPAYDVSYAGWDRSGAATSGAIAIHHPDTDEKRISFEDDPTTTTTYLQNSVPGDGTHVRVTDWDLGTTEPGSSGSPLFDPNRRVIGQLHGGFASCTSQTSDWYGKFSVSWTGGGTNSSRLSNWLDAAGTGAVTVDTISLATLCSDAGTIELSSPKFACEDTALISVVDCGLNANDTVVETVFVDVVSDSEPGGETVLLTETGASTGRFDGSIVLSGTDGAGVLLVGAGDQVTATYVDADDGMGGIGVVVDADALVDCTAPNILSVTMGTVDTREATVDVGADEVMLGRIVWGTSCGALNQSAEGSGGGTSDSIEIDGLSPGTTYYFRAEADDEAGNTGVDDNGGTCYSFTTFDAPDFLTEQFESDHDLSFYTALYEPDGSLGHYSVCSELVPGLPTDPAGGTSISLSDDGSSSVSVTGGSTVKLFGTSYSSFWVNANGNLTFDGSDGDYTETIEEHFAEPRVAVMWDDFNPSAGGTVSRKQLADRVVVTWEDVPEYSTSNDNTFQVELYFNGNIRITHAAMASTDGICGVSEGNGLDPDYVENDISAFGDCFSNHDGPQDVRGQPGGVLGPRGPIAIKPQ